MRNSITWFPYPRSWVNAIALLAIFFGLQYAINPLLQIMQWISVFWPNVWSIFYLIILLTPIIIIAFLHHWFHKILDQFVPDTRVVEVDGQSTIFPNLFSWWQGIYGLFVGAFAYIFALAVIGFIFSFGDIMAAIQNQIARPTPITLNPIDITQFIIRIVCIAYLYHIEFLVQQQLINSSRP
ncbi:hypothetical protein [Calothrix sp. NIES-3974]|uniref:hypothetical protein n=1 Tax=Calothrix sp. NIES-3974 TaxID=2005462 RepID=UPI000B60E924|nr:hypothetical protein [Calothrix sp. NIES-3974]BAZ05164.1 hypothetical protein NIES3974_18100 [Calothrix sp. NIES-3974]